MLRTLISGGNGRVSPDLLRDYQEFRAGQPKGCRYVDRHSSRRGQLGAWRQNAANRALGNHQAGRPSLKRRVSVSPPFIFVTSRASVRSEPFCLIFDAVISMGSSALKMTPTSSKNFLGQRKIAGSV